MTDSKHPSWRPLAISEVDKVIFTLRGECKKYDKKPLRPCCQGHPLESQNPSYLTSWLVLVFFFFFCVFVLVCLFVVVLMWHYTSVWPQQTVRSSCWSSMFNGIRPEPTNKRFNLAYLQIKYLISRKNSQIGTNMVQFGAFWSLIE